MKIRRAEPSDAPDIARVHVDSWRTTYTGIVPDRFLAELSYEKSTERHDQFFAAPEGKCAFVAITDEGNIVAYAIGGKKRQGPDSLSGELYAIYILKEHQGKGLGRLLTLEVAKWLKEQGHHSLVIWVLKENPACRFYEKMGGTPVADALLEIAGTKLVEIAYGWPNIDSFCQVENQEVDLNQTPALLVFKGTAESAARKGTILLFHGWGGSKETHFCELAKLAQQGFLAVGIDNVGHGKRRFTDFEARFASKAPGKRDQFFTAVFETAREVPGLINELANKNLVYEGRLGAVGVSMGGYITYRAVSEAPAITAAVAVVGSPNWPGDRPQSPHAHIDDFASVHLLSFTAAKDDIVPAVEARHFHQQLKKHYGDYAKRFSYVEFPDSEHIMKEDDWQSVWVNTAIWFETHLK